MKLINKILKMLTICIFVLKTLPAQATLIEPLDKRLAKQGLKVGDQIFVRIFKSEAVLEVWIKPEQSDKFVLFHTYPICAFSGSLGPKEKTGDKQAPEGFYAVGLNQLKPDSKFYRAFNLGYPNAYDLAQGYTGAYLMVHGNCVSEGCYAMTDKQIGEIYNLAESALKAGQPFFRVHCFPFKMSEANLSKFKKNKWYDFWLMLKPIYDRFEKEHIPPDVIVVKGKYEMSNK